MSRGVFLYFVCLEFLHATYSIAHFLSPPGPLDTCAPASSSTSSSPSFCPRRRTCRQGAPHHPPTDRFRPRADDDFDITRPALVRSRHGELDTTDKLKLAEHWPVWVNFGQSLAHSTKIGTFGSNVDRAEPKLVKMSTDSVDIGPSLRKFGQGCSNLDYVFRYLSEHHPKPSKFDRCMASVGQSLAKFGPGRPTCCPSRPMVVDIGQQVIGPKRRICPPTPWAAPPNF